MQTFVLRKNLRKEAVDIRTIILGIVFLMVLPTAGFAAIPPKPAYNSYVYDYAHVLDDAVEQQIAAIEGVQRVRVIKK